MAWEEVSIQGKTDLHNVDNITQTAQWYPALVDLYTQMWLWALEHSWQHRGDISEWFMQKTEPLLKFGAHSGQLRHSLSGAVKFKAQQKGRLFSW